MLKTILVVGGKSLLKWATQILYFEREFADMKINIGKNIIYGFTKIN